MNPHVAIITAAYRWKNFINDYLDSVTKQTYKNLSVWICDDYSQDDSVKELISNLSNIESFPGDPHLYWGTLNNVKIHLIASKENRRQGYARNKAIQYAWDKCDVLFNHDVDDYHYPQSVARHVEEYLKDPELIGLVYSDYHIWDKRTNITTSEHKQSFSWEELHKHCISSSNCLISKKAFAKCGPYNERVSPVEDYQLSLQISNFFVERHIPEHLWRYTVHGENCTIRELESHGQMYKVMVQDYQNWRKKNSI